MTDRDEIFNSDKDSMRRGKGGVVEEERNQCMSESVKYRVG